jgi:hypothetical protein
VRFLLETCRGVWKCKWIKVWMCEFDQNGLILLSAFGKDGNEISSFMGGKFLSFFFLS